jgi:hypothetical protein
LLHREKVEHRKGSESWGMLFAIPLSWMEGFFFPISKQCVVNFHFSAQINYEWSFVQLFFSARLQLVVLQTTPRTPLSPDS